VGDNMAACGKSRLISSILIARKLKPTANEKRIAANSFGTDSD